MIRILKPFCLLITLFALLIGCAQVIDLDAEQSGGQLVIYGRLTNGEDSFVNVSRTGDAGSAPVPVFGAEVSITNENGDTQNLVEGDSGTYNLPAGVIFGEEGVAYTLQVRTAGESYSSAPQRMPHNYGREEFSFEVREIETITQTGTAITESVMSVSARTDFDELPEEFYLKWDIEEAYTYIGTFLPLTRFPFTGGAVQCYVVNNLNDGRIFLHNGRENRATTIEERVFVDRPFDKSFQALHFFNLTRSSISKEAFEYWEQLDRVTNRQGSIFDQPPAGIKGNIRADNGDEEVLGFFEVASVEITRLRLTRNDVPFFFFDDCVRTGPAVFELARVPRDCRQCLADEGIVDADCLFCDVLPGSSGVRPSYFE